MKKYWKKKEDNTVWYLVGGLMAGVAAGYWLWRCSREKKHHDKPPRKAPQIKLENPGSQDDFPKPPMESEIG